MWGGRRPGSRGFGPRQFQFLNKLRLGAVVALWQRRGCENVKSGLVCNGWAESANSFSVRWRCRTRSGEPVQLQTRCSRGPLYSENECEPAQQRDSAHVNFCLWFKEVLISRCPHTSSPAWERWVFDPGGNICFSRLWLVNSPNSAVPQGESQSVWGLSRAHPAESPCLSSMDGITLASLLHSSSLSPREEHSDPWERAFFHTEH